MPSTSTEELFMNNTEKAYVAGIIDGEGTITLTRRRKNETPCPHISVANTNLEMLEWLRSKLGGIICSKKKYQPHHKQSYTWTIKLAGKCLQLLSDIRPYLIIKRQHADLLINEYRKVTPRNGKYTPEMSLRKLGLISEIRKLNTG